ncbi:hypothetical protein P4W15_00530 [Morganella morganii]|nr:hypothetical protein [Morganella morganii]
MPCIQLYTGNYLGGQPGKHGDYQDYAGLALETQYFPDGPNHPHWPDAVRGISAAGGTAGECDSIPVCVLDSGSQR